MLFSRVLASGTIEGTDLTDRAMLGKWAEILLPDI